MKLKYPEDYVKEWKCGKTAQGLSWYSDWLDGEDVDEPPNELIRIWIDFAREVLEALDDCPEAREMIDYA